MEHVNKFKAVLAAVTGALTALWGWLGWLVAGWIVCMAADYLTGSMAAAKEGRWNSAQAREGIWHKCGMIVVVLVAVGVDLLLEAALENLPGIQLPFTFGGLVCPMVLVWYIITELGSIAENGVKLGAPVPGWLVKLLAVGKDAVDQAGNKIMGEDGGKDPPGWPPSGGLAAAGRFQRPHAAAGNTVEVGPDGIRAVVETALNAKKEGVQDDVEAVNDGDT